MMKRLCALLVPMVMLSSFTRAGAPLSQADIRSQLDELNKKIDPYPLSSYVDPKYRHFFISRIPPLLQSKLDLLAQLHPTVPAEVANIAHSRIVTNAVLSLYDDNAAAALQTLADSKKPEEARMGVVSLAMSAYWRDRKATSQSAVLDKFEALAGKNPTDDTFSLALLTMMDAGPADAKITARINDFLETKMHSIASNKYRARPNKVGHPLHINGTTVDGKLFVGDRWKGKVVLVDFWATWCPPCREEIPHVVKMYEQYHTQGLEVIGVSCDSEKRVLADFVKFHPEMSWPQLFGPSARTGWHVLAEAFGIDSIPRMYLIDRSGVLRDVTALNDMEKQIPSLLAEQPDAPVPDPSSK